jgi:hypothetical protein
MMTGFAMEFAMVSTFVLAFKTAMALKIQLRACELHGRK